MKSLGNMIVQLEGLLDTSDVSAWEDGFISSIIQQTSRGVQTRNLTDKQVDTISSIYAKHFGD